MNGATSNKIVEYKCDVIHKVQDQLILYCSANLFLAIFMNNLPNQRVLLLPGLVWNPIEDQVVPLCRTEFRVRLKQPLFGLRNAFWNFLHHTLFASKSYIFSSTCSRLVVTYRISDILHEKNWIIPSSNLHADKAKPDKVTKILPFLILHLECPACPAPLPSFCSPGFGLQLCTNCKQGNLN